MGLKECCIKNVIKLDCRVNALVELGGHFLVTNENMGLCLYATVIIV